ncbi:MAG: hypothetical protein M3P96_06385 [Actinomycetota bacterium]|nr:hypothetical protein [Actinomycetota bacterium]
MAILPSATSGVVGSVTSVPRLAAAGFEVHHARRYRTFRAWLSLRARLVRP